MGTSFVVLLHGVLNPMLFVLSGKNSKAAQSSVKSWTNWESDKRVLQTRFLVLPIGLGMLAFCAAGLGFRNSSAHTLTQCLFADSNCSTALGTWFLGIVTSATFLAAYKAAISTAHTLAVARRTLEVETAPILGLARCTNQDHKHTHVAIFTNGGEISVDKALDGYGTDEFMPLNYDFENLGRTALLNLEVALVINGQSYPIRFGNIAAEKLVHVSLMLLWGRSPAPHEWRSPAKVADVANKNEYYLEFAALSTAIIRGVISPANTKEGERGWEIAFPHNRAPEMERAPLVSEVQPHPGRMALKYTGLGLSLFACCLLLSIVPYNFGWNAGKKTASTDIQTKIYKEHDRNLNMYTERHINNRAYDAHRALLKPLLRMK